MDRYQSTLLTAWATGSRRIKNWRYFQFRLGRFRSTRCFQTSPDPGQFLFLAAVGKEAEVTDVHEVLQEDETFSARTAKRLIALYFALSEILVRTDTPKPKLIENNNNLIIEHLRVICSDVGEIRKDIADH